MFEYIDEEGVAHEVTQAQVDEAAELEGITSEEYLAKMEGITPADVEPEPLEKTNDSQTTDVTVESEDMASNSENGSSELPEIEEFGFAVPPDDVKYIGGTKDLPDFARNILPSDLELETERKQDEAEKLKKQDLDNRTAEQDYEAYGDGLYGDWDNVGSREVGPGSNAPREVQPDADGNEGERTFLGYDIGDNFASRILTESTDDFWQNADNPRRNNALEYGITESSNTLLNSTDNNVVASNVKDIASSYLDINVDKNIKEINDKLKVETDTEVVNSLKLQKKTYFDEQGYLPLYNVDGDETSGVRGYLPAEVQNEADDLANSTSSEENDSGETALQLQRKQLWAELIHLGGKASDLEGLPSDESELGSVYSVLGSAFTVSGGKSLRDNLSLGGDFSQISFIKNSNTLPKDLEALPGNSLVARKFNERLKKYKVLNRAIEIQAGLGSLKEESLFGEFLDDIDIAFGGDGLNATEDNDRVVQVYKDIMEYDMGYKVDAESIVNREGSSNKRRLIEGGLNIATDIAPLAAEIYLMRKIPLGSVAKYDKYVKNGVKMTSPAGRKAYTLGDAMNKSKVGLTNFLLKGNKSKAYAAGVNLTVGGVDEVAKLYLADQVGGALWNQPGFVHNTKTGEASFAFPFGLGVGNVAGARIINALKTKYVPILTPVLARFPKSKAASAFAQANVSAAVGTSTLVFAEMFDGFIKDLTGQEKIEAEEKDMFHHLAENYLGMFFLGGKATLTKMGKGLHKDISQSNILPKRLKGTTKAERKLGLKYGAEPEAVEASKKEKLNEISEKYKDKDLTNQETLDKYNKERSEVRKSANDLQYFHEYNAAKKTAKAKDGYYKNLSEKFIIGNKMQQGKDLTTKEKELIAELEPHEFDYLIAGTGMLPSSKQATGMRRLKEYYENINKFIGGDGLRLQGNTKTEFFEKYDKHNDNMAEIQRLEKEAKSKPAVKKINLEKIEKLKEKNEKIESELNEINQGFEKVFEKMLEKEIEIAKVMAESTGLKGEFKAVSEQAFQEMLNKKAGLKFSKGQKSGIGGYYDRASDSIWLNKEHLKDYRDLGAPLHEVTHAILKKSLKFKNGKLTKEGRQAIDKFLEGLNEKDRAIVEKRVNDNYRFETFKNEAEYVKAVNSGMFGNVKGGMPNQLKDVLALENGNIRIEKKPEFFAEEYVTAWSDAVKNKQIKYTPELGQKLSDAFYPLLKKVGLSSKFEINDINGENLFMAMQTIQRGSIKGKLRGDIVQLGKAAREGDYTGNVMSKNITKEQAEQAIADVKKMKELERFNLEMLDKYRPEQMNKLRNEISEAKKDLSEARSLNEKDIAKQDIKNAERKLDEFISNELNADAVYKRASDRFKAAIGETTGRLATALTKRLFDPIAQDYKGSVTREGYKESLIGELEQMVIKEYKPELQGLEAFITNRGWLRAQSLAKRLGVLQEVVEGGKQKEYGGLQDFGTQRSIKLLDLVEGIDRTRGEKLRAIEDKVKADVGKAKDILSVIKTFMPKAKFELVDYKDLKSEYLTDIVDTFVTGVRAGEFKGKEIVGNRAMAERIVKAMKKSADLNKPEMMLLQKVFDKFHDSFWASLPQGYTSTAKATMNRPKSLYEAYYNEVSKRATQETFGISAGKQGRNPFVKLPTITPSNFKLPLGIKPEGNYVNLREHGGLYKLLMGEYARAFENQATRSIMPPAEAWAKHLADGRSPLMFSKNKNEMSVNEYMQQGRDIRNVYEIGKSMIESFGNKKKYREATRGVDPVVVDAIEQLMMNRNENLTVGGNGYQKQVLLNSFTPEVIRNLITPSGQWKGLKLNDPTTKGKYVEQAFEFAKLLPPSMSSTWIENALGLKDGYKGTIKVTDYKVQREALKNRKFTPEQQKKFDKLAKDLKIDVENLGNAKQMMNSGYVGKVLESLGREVSLSKKKATLEGYKGELSNVNRANHDMLKLFNELMRQEYSSEKKGTIDANFVMLNGALQTNIVAGKRAMSTFEYIYLREGKQQGLSLPAKSKKIKGVNTNITNTPEYKQKYKEYIDSWKECAEWNERFEYNKKNPKKGKTTEELTLSDLQWKNEHLGASATTNAESASYMYSNGKSISLENINNGHRTLWAPKWVCDKVLDAKLEVDGKLIDNKVSYEGPMRITKFAKEILTPGKEILHFTGENAITHIMKANKVAEIVNEITDMSNASVQKVGAKMTQFGVFSKNNPKQTKANIKIFDKAMELGRDPNKKSRGMSTFDFDETLVIGGKNSVTATKGKESIKITSEEFPLKGPELAKQGYKFDFSDFVNVKGGKEGPLMQKLRNQIEKYGTDNVFVLTARMQEAAPAIHTWLKSKGVELKLKNITGLGNSTGEAKAMWMLEKFSEGYNDMYFVDDALPNVKAVKDVLKQLDIKSNVQQALMFSKSNRDKAVNDIMEHAFGIESKKKFSKAEGKVRGKDIKRRRIFIPDGAADLELLIEPLYGKGKKGVENKKWFENNFQRPWERGINDFNNARQAITTDYMSLRKKMKDVVKLLPESVEGTNFTHDMAIRAYIWNKAGHKIPDLAPTTKNKLVSFVESNPSLKAYAETVSKITRVEGGLKEPSAEWWGETLATEIQGLGEGIGRKKYIQEFIDIKNEIFSETNLSKMESQLGTRWRESIEDMFERMETGRSRSLNLGRTSNAMMNYLNGSVGAIMNFNTRSAALQLISSVNFVNHSFNNPLKAAAAFANQPQYWKDFMTIMNSDMLKQRRAGLEINVTEAELASAVRGSKNPAKAALSYILKAGFLPTKIADSFAISAGGSTFYRNSINKYVKEGLDVKEAERKAFLDFQAVAERTQQSSRADLISQQQTSLAGRFILPFANTPLQMNRIMMKEVLDISKGRYKGYYGENSMTHKLSKIAYFGFAQSLIFAGLQSGAFALMTNSDDEKLVANSKLNSLNTVADSFLRGMGIQGAVLNGFRLAVQEFIKQDAKKYNADYSEVGEKLLNISPTVGSKFSKLDQAGNTYNYNKKVIKEEGLTLNGPLMEASTQVIEATTNLPLNRYYRKGQNIQNALDDDYENWQRILMGAGWSNWGLGVGDPKVINKGKENEYTKYRTKEDLRREGIKEKVKKDTKKAKKANQQRCTKIKSDYSRCKMMVDKPKTRCHYHD